jgi:hypothetical protein
MDFSFVVLSFHKNAQETFCCLKVEDLSHVVSLIIMKSERLGGNLNLVVCRDDFGDGHADVPNNFWSALALVFKFVHNQINDLFDIA